MKHITELELIEYATGSIGQSQKAGTEEHLAQCESCRQMCEQTKLIYNSLSDFAAPQVNDLTTRVRQGVNAQTAFGWKHFVYDFSRVAAVIILSVSAGYFAAVKFTPGQQSDSISFLKNQSEFSFVQPARHIAMAVSGEIK
jgi:predicted anti-sigma-YlaC factor YlaD